MEPATCPWSRTSRVEGEDVPGVGVPLFTIHRGEHGCSIRSVEGVDTVNVERDVLSGVSLNGCLHALHRPLRAAGRVQGELDGLEDVGVVPLSMLWQCLAANLRKNSPMARGRRGSEPGLGMPSRREVVSRRRLRGSN
jgi:hypothetical protein